MHELPPKLMLQTVGKVRGTLATVHISIDGASASNKFKFNKCDYLKCDN